MPKSAISFKNIYSKEGTGVSNPFWFRPKSKESSWKNVLRIIWKWLKLAIFAFLMLMGLWGCFQSMWDPTIAIQPNIGAGMEFGFNFGQTGDWRFDLSSSSILTQYNTFSSWSLAYGPFYAFFVWPASFLVLNFMYATKNWWGGLNTLMAIFILLLIIRLLSIAITLRSTLQTEKMNEVQGKISEINAKYKNVKDPQSRQRKQQEIMQIYSKNKIKPFAAFEQMFITLPIFLIIYRVVTIVRPVKASVLFGIWNFSLVPVSQIFSNFTDMGWTYIFFLILVIPSQWLSMKIPQIWAKKRSYSASTSSIKGEKQMKKIKWTQNIFVIVMCAIVCFSATGVGVYWFLNALFSIGQTYIMHRVILHNRKKGRSLDSYLSKLGVE